MRDIQETRLPGVGVRHDFVTTQGTRIGVISHRGGRKELLVYDRRDPDRAAAVLRLEEEDVRTLDELLAVSRVTQELTRLQQSVEGLTIDWLHIPPDSTYHKRTIGDSALRSRTGVSIVAIIRGDETSPAPAPDVELHADDTVVAVGTPEGMTQAFQLLSGG